MNWDFLYFTSDVRFSRTGLRETLCYKVVRSHTNKPTLFISRLGAAFILLLAHKTKSAGCYLFLSTLFKAGLGSLKRKHDGTNTFSVFFFFIPLLDKAVEVFGPYLLDGVDGLSGDPKISAKSI